ncbi:hypothetical protein L1887_41898 [Cichorium endivia]|nr:hypothetical protein L1887_41898 [Cichorium endivia]
MWGDKNTLCNSTTNKSAKNTYISILIINLGRISFVSPILKSLDRHFCSPNTNLSRPFLPRLTSGQKKKHEQLSNSVLQIFLYSLFNLKSFSI